MANQFPMGGGGSRPKLIITGNSGPGSLYESNDTLSIADDTLILESQKGDTPGWTPEGGALTTAATFVATSAASLLVEYAGLTKTIAKSQGAITVSGLADQTVAHGAAVSIDAASAFSGTVTTYSIVSGPAWLSINPVTGAITGTAPGSDVTVSVTVQASNNAGSVTDTFVVSVEEISGLTGTWVFALGGQSNMVGQGSTDALPGYPAGTLQVARGGATSGGASGDLVAAAEPLDHVSTGGGMSLAVEFVRQFVADNPEATVCLVPCAASGTGFVDTRWNQGDDLYNSLVSRTNTVLAENPEFNFGGILWHQGEKDAASSVAKATYKANLNAMLDAFATDITAMTPVTPVVVGGLPVHSVERNGASYKDTQAAIYETAAERGYCSIADSRYPVPAVRQVDSLHWDAWSLREMGRQYYEAFKRAAANEAYTQAGPNTAINLSGAEAGALRHWLLGADNPNDTDLVYGGKLSAQGDVSLSRGAGFLSLPGLEGSGLFADVLETDDITVCAVLRRTSGSFHVPLGQLFPVSYATTEWGITSNDRFYRPDNGYSALAQADTLGEFYFYAVSLSASGAARAYCSNGGSPSSVDTTVAARNRTSVPAAVTFGPGLYQSTTSEVFNGDLDFAEAIVFDSAKTIAEIGDIYSRAKSRLSARGITLS